MKDKIPGPGNDKFRAIAIDDDENQLSLMEELLKDNPFVSYAGGSTSPQDTAELIKFHKPEILFLDVEMPGKNGFQVLDEIREMGELLPEVIFVTAHNEHAVRAFEYAALDYLLKPVEPFRLELAIQRAVKREKPPMNERAGSLLNVYDKLIFRTYSGYLFVNPADIIYAEADGNYCVLHLTGSIKEVISGNIGNLERILEPSRFFRIHRSCIIALPYLSKLYSGKKVCVLLKDGKEYKCQVAGERISELMTRMKT